eukprot:g1529.t1
MSDDSDAELDDGQGWSQQEVATHYRRMQADRQREERAREEVWQARKDFLWSHATLLVAAAFAVLSAGVWYLFGTSAALGFSGVAYSGLGFWHWRHTRLSVCEQALKLAGVDRLESAREAHRVLQKARQELHVRAVKSFQVAKTHLQNRSQPEFVRRQLAAPLLKQADQIACSIMRDDSLSFIKAFHHLGECFKHVGDPETAFTVWAQLQQWWKLLAAGDAAETAMYTNFLRQFAHASTESAQHGLAARLLTEVNEIVEKAGAEDGGGADGIGMVHGLIDLATAHLGAGAPKKALPLLTRAESVLKKALLAEHPQSNPAHNPLMVMLLTHKAKAAVMLKNVKGAIELFETAAARMGEVEALYRRAAAQGQTQPDGEPIVVDDVLRQRLNLTSELAMLNARERHFDLAEKLLRDLAEDVGTHFGEDSDERLGVLSTLAHVFKQQKGAKDPRIEPLLAQVRDGLEAREGTGSVEHAMSSRQLVELFAEQGRFKEAEELMRRVEAMLCAELGPGHQQRIAALQQRGDLLCALKKHAEAEVVYTECMAVMGKEYGQKDIRLAMMMCDVGDMHMKNKAEKLLSISLDVIREQYRFSPQHSRALNLMHALFMALKKPKREIDQLNSELAMVDMITKKMEAGMSMEQIAAELHAANVAPMGQHRTSQPVRTSSIGSGKRVGVNRKKLRKKNKAL